MENNPLLKIRKATEFAKSAEKHEIDRWMVHTCSMCGYPCSYLFRQGEVYYDAGCYCTTVQSIKIQDWNVVAEHFNMQVRYYLKENKESTLEYIKGMCKFWRFI